MMRLAPVFRSTAVVAGGFAGGYVWLLLGLPLPWTLGAMMAAALMRLAGPQWVLPPIFRDTARPVIGFVAGSAFTPAILAAAMNWWQMAPLLIAFMLAVTVTGQIYFRKICGFDRATALFASMPGGLAEMLAQGSQFGANIPKLVIVHSMRVFMVAAAIPFVLTVTYRTDLAGTARPTVALGGDWTEWVFAAICICAGYLLGRRMKALGGPMIAALLISAIAHGGGYMDFVPPNWVIVVMQVVIGSVSGARFAGIRFSEALGVLVRGAFWTFILLGLAAIAAAIAGQVLPMPPGAHFLAFAPGGFSEVTVIALASGIEVAFVVSTHVLRTLYIYLSTPLLRHALAGRGSEDRP